MSLTDLMPSTKDKLIAGLQARLTEVTTLLARGVSERDLDEARPGSALWDSRVLLGLDGKTGARDVRSDVASALRCPTCTSPQPSMHPAIGGGGEVTGLCGDAFHRVGLSLTPVVLAVDPGVQVEQESGR